jgi:hypothetical protein
MKSGEGFGAHEFDDFQFRMEIYEEFKNTSIWLI